MVTQMLEHVIGSEEVTTGAVEASTDRADARIPDASIADVRILPPRVVNTLTDIFAALEEPSRLRIVHALSQAELCVGDLAGALDMAVPAVSQHLRVLRDRRIVRKRRAGKMVYYALDDSHVADLFAVALEHALGAEPS